ncbi:MAG: DUF6890 family protein [Desulfovibrio sp.]
MALSRHYFPAREPDAQSMGEALWLHKDHWQNMSVAVANGIAQAFNK